MTCLLEVVHTFVGKDFLEEEGLEGHKVLTFEKKNWWRDIDGDRKMPLFPAYIFIAYI